MTLKEKMEELKEIATAVLDTVDGQMSYAEAYLIASNLKIAESNLVISDSIDYVEGRLEQISTEIREKYLGHD
jgi:hypothetical protein